MIKLCPFRLVPFCKLRCTEIALSFIFLGCDLEAETRSLKAEMYKRFSITGKRPIYTPEEFQELCAEAEAPSIFSIILATMANSRHSN